MLRAFYREILQPGLDLLLGGRQAERAAIDVLHISRSRVFNNLERYGNTSAGSVPLALDEALAELAGI